MVSVKWVSCNSPLRVYIKRVVFGAVMTKRKKNKSLRKEEIAEDWCFVCKDGGELLICDYGQCLKAYHPQCVKKDNSILTSDESWRCGWHNCYFCHRNSRYHCYCCEFALCRNCFHATEFARVKGTYGFCTHCLKLALLVEENVDVDSEGETVDLSDRQTYEGLFREYYEIVKGKKGFDKNSLLAAKDRLNGKNEYQPADSDEGSEEEDEQLISDYENLNEDKPHKRGRKRKINSLQRQKLQEKFKSKKQEYIGWGSKPLVEFLQFIGHDTTEKLSQHDVSVLINKYVQEHDLFHPVKKRRIVCDARLRAVLGKKEVKKQKISQLLEVHFAENEESSEEEELADELNEKDREILVASKTGKQSDPNKKLAKKHLTPAQSQFAAFNRENMELVYLKKSLVLDMIKQSESAENKIIGSFVRIKSDPCDYSQRNSHQLVQITGIKQGSSGKGNEIVLQASDTFRDICLSMLSDDDLTLEECNDLKDKAKAGIRKKLTVVELEQKARTLHEDITKNWIARELSLLQKRIDQANEKGWRSQLFDYMDKKKRLENPSEQLLLLQKLPTVTPDVVELESLAEHKSHDKQGRQCLSETTPSPSKVVFGEQKDGETFSEKKEQQCHPYFPEENAVFHIQEQPRQLTTTDPIRSNTSLLQEKRKAVSQSEVDADIISIDDAKGNQQVGSSVGSVEVESKEQEKIEFIDLSSDDDATPGVVTEGPDECIWHISGQIEKNEKYSLSLLKRWAEKTPSACKFKVWKEGQSEEKAIWLSKAINLALPRK